MVPTTRDARLHHIGSQLVGPRVELGQLGCGTDTTTMRWKPRTEDIGDQAKLLQTANRAGDGGRSTDVARSTKQLRMGVAHLVLTQASAVIFVDQVPTREPMVDHSARSAQGTYVKRLGTERHDSPRYRCAVSAMVHTTRGTLCT